MRTVYEHGIVYTGDAALQQAFAVEDGRILATGTDAELRNLRRDVSVDLQGNFVTAGFNDSHMHLLNLGKVLSGADLASHTDSLQGMLDYLKGYLLEHPLGKGEWLLGRGWNQDYFSDTDRMPGRRHLDSISAMIPIMITRTCGHCCAVNSKVLEIAGITAATNVPEGGAIGMEDGEPDGRLYDNAIDLVTKLVPLPDQNRIMEMLVTAMKMVNRYGITSVQTDDYGVFPDIPAESVNEAYRMLEKQRCLSIRVYEQCNFTEPAALETFIRTGNRTGTGGPEFRIGPVKLLGDGALGSRTAHLSIPYVNTTESGFNLLSNEKMETMIELAHSSGMQIAVHAIGDACLDQVLDAFDRTLKKHPRTDHRHGIVHCQITRQDQLERIRALNLHVYAQSVFLDYDNHIVNRIVAPELAATSYHWKTLMRMGVCVSNGSDSPVEKPDVMKGIECAVTRTSMDGTGPYLPDEAFTVREALDSFTAAGAYASFEESVKGKIRPGMLADFVILEQNPLIVPPEMLHTVRVLGTYLGGQPVYLV